MSNFSAISITWKVISAYLIICMLAVMAVFLTSHSLTELAESITDPRPPAISGLTVYIIILAMFITTIYGVTVGSIVPSVILNLVILAIVVGSSSFNQAETHSFISTYDRDNCQTATTSFANKVACPALNVIRDIPISFIVLAPVVLAHTFNGQESSIKSEK